MARTYQLEEPLAESAADVFEGLFGLKVKVNRWQARISPLMELLGGIAVAILLFVVGWRMSLGTMTLADFTGLLTGLGVAVSPARQLGSTYAAAATGGAALDRIFMLFDTQNTIVDGPRTLGRAVGPDRLRARRLRLSRRARGARGGLVRGASPARASPSSAALAPASRPSSTCCRGSTTRPRGGIRLDGIDIRELTLASLRDQIAVVSQDSVLLTGTVAQNIGFGRRDADPRRDRGRGRAPPPPTASSARCPRATTPGSSPPRRRSPAASASGCRSRARSCATRRSCCSTSPPRRSTPRASR